MIEFKIGDDHIAKLTLTGNIETIIFESEMFVNSVYSSLLNVDEEAAEMFKNIFQVIISISDNVFKKSKFKYGANVVIKAPRNGACGNGNS